MHSRLFAVFSALLVQVAAGFAAPADGFLHNGVTAHRGDAAGYPENTLPAFQSAIQLGADWIELDVIRTRDGKLVISHDRTTGRVGDKDLVVSDSTYEQLQTVDVATRFRREHGRTIKDCPRHTMALLEDAIRLVTAQNHTRVSMHPKGDCVTNIVELVRRLGAEQWAGFNDTDFRRMAEAKRLLPKCTVFWDRMQANIDEDSRLARQHGFETVVMRADLVKEEEVKAIHRAGLEAGAWTVNDAAAMKRMLDLGIDRIYTDDPARLLNLKRERTQKPRNK